MTRVLVDCRAIEDDHGRDLLAELRAAMVVENPAVDTHFLVDADRLIRQPDFLDRLGLSAHPARTIHRLHAPPHGRTTSSFASWRDRVRSAIALSVAIELDAGKIIVPASSVVAARALWPEALSPSSIQILAAVWRHGRIETHELTPPSAAAQAALERPLLALVSPLPPEQSGIADYAMELIPELARHYRLELVVREPAGITPQLSSFQLRDIDWFRRNADCYDRIVYQFGNSDFHQHMFELNETHPGLVVLHDAFLSGVVRHMEVTRLRRGFFSERLYRDHGYRAVADRWRPRGALNAVLRHPCSLGVISNSLGTVVHSLEARSIVAEHYGATLASELTVIPHLRAATDLSRREQARRALGMDQSSFLVCSFGATSETKMNDRLLTAWQSSSLARDSNCRLVFVGGGRDAYTRRLVRASAGSNAHVTGRCSADTYRTYLQAADVGVQLRRLSRGETSGAALDCLAGGLPLIVNAHGSMAELPRSAVTMIEDEFSDAELVGALEALRHDAVERARLRDAALEHVRVFHDPTACGRLYVDAIEAAHARPKARAPLRRLLANALPPAIVPGMAETAAACARLSLPSPREKARIFFDVTAIARNDLRSGIERTVRNLLTELLEKQPEGFRVEPVRLEQGRLMLARTFACQLLGIRQFPLPDEPVAVRPGDIYVMVDLAHRDVVEHRQLYRAMRRQGVRTAFMVHDLLPVRRPDYFPPRAEADHAAWLDVVAEADVAVGVTRHVAEDLADWYATKALPKVPAIGFSHHGAELQAEGIAAPPSWWERFRLRRLGRRPAFLCVGTVEPRKGHDDLLAAFETLWADGRDADLVIVGRAGFRPLDVIKQMRRHPERGRRLFWFTKASDGVLDQLYRTCDCLVAPSRAEGFGLPLIEAGLHGLPVLARDIAVSREVAPEGTRFFADTGPAALTAALKEWLDAPPPRIVSRDVLSWEQSAANLIALVTGATTPGDNRERRHFGMLSQ